MDSEVVSFAQVAIIIVCLVGSLSLIGTITYKVLTRGGKRAKAVEHHDDERLEHLQQSIDAIAIEVERIAEAQRFSAKLLADRGEKVSLPSAGDGAPH